MNKIAILLSLILFCSCGSRTFDGRFERFVETDAEMHFGPGPPPPAVPYIQEKTIIVTPPKEVPGKKQEYSTGSLNA